MSKAAALERILVGVDFDESSASALAAAGEIARTMDARLTVVHSHSVALPAYFTGAEAELLETEREEGRARCSADVAAFARLHTQMPHTVIVEEGPPAATLVRLSPQFDLVVVGTRRLRGARRWWLGSVAETVVREAAAPVLVVPTHPSAAEHAVLERKSS